MPTLPPPGVYCVRLEKADVNAVRHGIVTLTFLTAPGHGVFAGQRLTATISLDQPTSDSIQKLKSAFRIVGDDIEDFRAAVGRWGFVAIDWATEGWEPKPVARFIQQTPLMRQQSAQIELAEFEGRLEWPRDEEEDDDN